MIEKEQERPVVEEGSPGLELLLAAIKVALENEKNLEVIQRAQEVDNEKKNS